MTPKSFRDCEWLAKQLHVSPFLVAEIFGIRHRLRNRLRESPNTTELWELLDLAPEGSDIHTEILQVLLDRASKLEDVERIIDAAVPHSSLERKALEHFDSLCIARAKRLTKPGALMGLLGVLIELPAHRRSDVTEFVLARLKTMLQSALLHCSSNHERWKLWESLPTLSAVPPAFYDMVLTAILEQTDSNEERLRVIASAPNEGAALESAIRQFVTDLDEDIQRPDA